MTTPVYLGDDQGYCSLKCANNADVNHMALKYNAERQHQESLQHASQSPTEDDE